MKKAIISYLFWSIISVASAGGLGEAYTSIEASCFKVKRTFQEYLDYIKPFGAKPTLVFPGGSKLPVTDERYGLHNRKLFYTIDISSDCEPDICGDIFDLSVWKQLPDQGFQVVHAERPDNVFLYPARDIFQREQQDCFILEQVHKKLCQNGCFMLDLRYERFQPLPNAKSNYNFESATQYLKDLQRIDPFVFERASFRTASGLDDRVQYLTDLFQHHPDKVRYNYYNEGVLKYSYDYFLELLSRPEHSLCDKIYKKADKIERALPPEVLFALQKPYLTFYTSDVRQAIHKKYEEMFKPFGFKKFILFEIPQGHPEGEYFFRQKIRIHENIRVLPCGYIFYKGFLFTETMAIFIKVSENKSVTASEVSSSETLKRSNGFQISNLPSKKQCTKTEKPQETDTQDIIKQWLKQIENEVGHDPAPFIPLWKSM